MLLTGERYHKETSAYFLKHSKTGSTFFTNDYVLDEAWTRLITQQSVTAAKVLKAKIEEAERHGNLTVFWTDDALFEQSWKTFLKFSEHRFSFTDAVIMTVVRAFRIDEILTLDQGFKKAGFTSRPMLRL